MKQRRLIPLKTLPGLAFGGDLLKKSHAKTKRPFSPRAAVHVVMRARSPYSLLKKMRRQKIASIVEGLGKHHHVHIHRFANAGNHLHFLVECRERKGFIAFLRAVSGAIARFIKATEPGDKSFWLQRPWTRVVAASGRAFVTAWRYVDLNEIEGGCWGITRTEARAIAYGDLGPPKPWLRGSCR